MSTNDGGPAFPGEKSVRFGQASDCNEGMTLRDYFAIRATEQDIENHRAYTTSHSGSGKRFTMTVEQAKYAYADAMLKARTALSKALGE